MFVCVWVSTGGECAPSMCPKWTLPRRTSDTRLMVVMEFALDCLMGDMKTYIRNSLSIGKAMSVVLYVKLKASNTQLWNKFYQPIYWFSNYTPLRIISKCNYIVFDKSIGQSGPVDRVQSFQSLLTVNLLSGFHTLGISWMLKYEYSQQLFTKRFIFISKF